MAIAIRKKGGKFYAPTRDIMHWMQPALRAALAVCGRHLMSDPDAIHRLGNGAVALAGTCNRAIADETQAGARETLAGLFTAMQGDKATFNLFARVFMVAVFARYVIGSRETADTVELDDRALEKALADASLVAMLPPELADKVEAHLRQSGRWPDLLDLPAAHTLITEPDVAAVIEEMEPTAADD